MRSVPLWDAGTHLDQLAGEVDRTREPVHLTKDGREYVVLVSGGGHGEHGGDPRGCCPTQRPRSGRDGLRPRSTAATSSRRTSSGACATGYVGGERPARRLQPLTRVDRPGRLRRGASRRTA